MRPMRVWLAMFLLLVSAGLRAQVEAPDADWRYRIQPGDTLITLTDAWLAPPRTWRDLQKLNRVPDPLRLMPGATLRMPVGWLRREASVAEAMFTRGRSRASAARAPKPWRPAPRCKAATASAPARSPAPACVSPMARVF